MSSLIFPHPPGSAMRVLRVPVDRTGIQTSGAGQEARIRRLTAPLYRYEIDINFLRSDTALAEFQQIATFIAIHGGRYDSFLWQDPEDNAVTAHGFGVGNGSATVFHLQRTLGGQVSDVTGSYSVASTPRTNLLLRSQEFGNAAWTKAGSTAVASSDVIIAPDGTLTGDYITCTNVNESISQAVAGTYAIGSQWTFSVWLAGVAGETSTIRIDTVGGTAESVTTSITHVGATMWKRASVTLTVANSGHTSLRGAAFRATGQTCVNVNLWGAQFESGTVATAYIPTTSAAVRKDPAYWPLLGDGFEPVYDPIWSTVAIYKAGVAQTPGTDFTIGAHGLVTFASGPSSGAALTWSGSYYRRVRFDDDEPQFERFMSGIWKTSLAFASVIP